MVQTRRRQFRLWCSLHSEIQRRILYSPVLSLCELAQLAVTCKLFWEVYRERCAADEGWLVQSATSAFGCGLTDALLRRLARLQRKRKSAEAPLEALLHDGDIRIFDLTQGEQLPDEHTLRSLRMAALITPVQGLLAAGQQSCASWLLADATEATVALKPEGLPLLLQISYATQQFLAAIVKPSSPTQMVPCLGLVHLACKHVAAAESRKAGLRGWQLPPRQLVRKVPVPRESKELSCWNNASTVVDAQRALSVMHMWNRRFGSGIPHFFMVLSDTPVVWED
eukprot:jgi/Botrbrau1/15522/Bobra.0225s0011.1